MRDMEDFKHIFDEEVCIHDEDCGGCIMQGMLYDEQLRIKESASLEEFKKRGVEFNKYDGIIPSHAKYRYEYRNKMEYTFGDFEKGGQTTLGMHGRGRFMSITTVDHCQLVHEDFNKILRFTLDFVVKNGYPHYHKKSHQGLMRHLIVRRGIRSGQLLINIVTSSQMEWDKAAFVNGLLSLELKNNIVGILHTVNDQVADAVIVEEVNVLWGRDYYEEIICGLKFIVGAFSFFQTNVEAAEVLYEKAISLLPDFTSKKALDLYCGTGTITQLLAEKAKEAVGIDIVEESIDVGRKSAKLNGLDNIRFYCGDAHKVLKNLDFAPDVIVVDPPRMGMKEQAVEELLSYGVDNIIYISCNPKTMAMNLEQMKGRGYVFERLILFDNYSNTKHVEAVVLMSKVR